MKKNILQKGILGLLGMVVIMALFSGVASAANGDNLRQISGAYSQGSCSINTGLAFDGTNLLVTCWYYTTIDKLSPADGSLVGSINVPGYGGFGAAAWDGSRNKLWVCADGSNVILANTADGSSTSMFISNGCIDGLAYDGTDDTIWASPDVSSYVYHYKTDGTLLGSFYVGSLLGGYGNSGIAVGGDKLYLANDGGSQIYELPKDLSTSTLFASFPARLEDLECDDITFASQGVGAIWSIDAYDRTINAWEIPQGKCGFGGLPPSGGNISGMKFNDLNNNGTNDAEPGIANWEIRLTKPDGSTVSMWTDGSGNYKFSGLAAGTYTVAEVQQAGWTQTAPTPPTYTISLADGESVTGKDFGNHQQGGGIQLEASCVATVNPSGKQIPTAGANPKSGQNPDGFYMIGANDPLAGIFVVDTGSNMQFGPFASGTNIKYTQAKGVTPNQKNIGGPNSAVAYHITGKGDAAVYAMNTAGDKSPSVSCLVPPPPK